MMSRATYTHTHTRTHTHTHTHCGITMGQLIEGCGFPVEVWLPHHKMAAIRTTSPRMQQDPRCRCLRHPIERALKSGGACEAREPGGTRADGAPDVHVKRLLKRLLKRNRK